MKPDLTVATLLHDRRWGHEPDETGYTFGCDNDNLAKIITSWEDLPRIGSNNIRALIKERNENINDIKEDIKEYTEILNFLSGKSGADIAKYAKKYDNPTFAPEDMTKHPKGIPDGWSDELEPTKPSDREREANSTTFNVCGWCKYAMGTGRFNYTISGDCMIMRNVGVKRPEKYFYTKCEFHQMSVEAIQGFVNLYIDKIAELQSDLATFKAVVAHAKLIAEETTKRPYLLSLRPYDQFNIGNKAICYIGDVKQRADGPKLITDKLFITGKVIDGYRHHDGCVSMRADEPWHDGDYLEGRGTGWGWGRADFMLKSEYDYLISHPDFLKLWLDSIYEYRSEKGEYNSFKKAMLTQVR
jgi:hypothetical protein